MDSMETLFAKWEGPLLSYACRLLDQRPLAEDTVQEAFMKLHSHLSEVREPVRWLYRTVHNLALNHRRRSKRMIALVSRTDEDNNSEAPEWKHDPADPGLLPDEALSRWERNECLKRCVQKLDPKSREVVRLKFEEDRSYREISEATGLSVTNVGYILHHALKSMASELTSIGVPI